MGGDLGAVMMKWLFVAVLLVACVEEVPEAEPVFDSGVIGDHILFQSSPECPEGWGPVVVKMSPGYDYETVEIHCGLVVEPEEVPGE